MPPITTFDDPDDDEDWYDGDDDPGDDEDDAECPECGQPVPSVTDKCPACGYWLSAADRRRMRPSDSKPAWLKVTTIVLLAAMLLGLVAALFY